jgi:hypothetical protein
VKSHIRDRQPHAHIHTYLEDPCILALERAFLGGSSTLLRHDEDALAIVAVMARDVAEVGGT